MKKMNGVIQALAIPVDAGGRLNPNINILPSEIGQSIYLGKELGLLLRMPFTERLKFTEQIIENYKGRASIFVECGAMSVAQTMVLAETCQRAGADGISVVSPLFYGVTQSEQEHYYKNLAKKLSGEYPIYLRYISKLCNHSITREMLENMMVDIPNIVGLIDDSTDAVKMLSLAKNKEYQLVTDNDIVFEVARLLGYDGYIS